MKEKFIETAEKIVFQEGDCYGVSCDDCPALNERIKKGLSNCSELWGGGFSGQKEWFENWLMENKEGDQSNSTKDIRFCDSTVSLRDYFAAKAIQGMLASGKSQIDIDGVNIETHGFAAVAFHVADSMLKEREKV